VWAEQTGCRVSGLQAGLDVFSVSQVSADNVDGVCGCIQLPCITACAHWPVGQGQLSSVLNNLVVGQLLSLPAVLTGCAPHCASGEQHHP